MCPKGTQPRVACNLQYSTVSGHWPAKPKSKSKNQSRFKGHNDDIQGFCSELSLPIVLLCIYVLYSLYIDSSHTWNGCSVSVFNPSVFAAEEPSRKITSLSGQPFLLSWTISLYSLTRSFGPAAKKPQCNCGQSYLATPEQSGFSWFEERMSSCRGTRLSILMLVLVSLGQSMILRMVCESCVSCSGSSQLCFLTKVAESFEAFIISYLIYAISSKKRFTIWHIRPIAAFCFQRRFLCQLEHLQSICLSQRPCPSYAASRAVFDSI